MSKDSGKNFLRHDVTESSLRDRITTVLAKVAEGRALYAVTNADVAVMSDAVIAELGMTRESAVDGISPVDDPPPGQHRYVTEWRDND